MERYIFKYDPQVAEGVYGVSPVLDPANESMAVFMAKETNTIQDVKLSVEGEKRLMTGIVLIPNQRIYRFNQATNQEYEIEFDAEGIRLLSQDFFKNGYHTNAWVNHKSNEKIDGFTFVRSWIVEDPNSDAALALGLTNLVKGMWIMSAWVENDAVWEMAKNGELKGFSIDSILNFEKIEMNININNKKETKKEKDKIKTVMHEFKHGDLHSGSKKGPIVRNTKQAIAISLREAGVPKKKK